jgi:hypothetical protein
MNTQQKSKWLVDAALFGVFIVSFFLDITGLVLHQWIGLFAGAIAVYHLVTHWNWVTAVTRRFFGQTNNKSRLYYALDAMLVTGFATIASTGLLISTWLNLPLENYDLWRTIHIGASIGTLAVTVLKLAAHWRWIANVAKTFVARPAAPQLKPALARATGAKAVSRRNFLEVMGAVGIASFFAMGNAVKSLQPAQAEEPAASAQTNEVASTNVAAVTTNTQTTAATDTNVAVAANTQAATATSTTAAAATSQATSTPVATTITLAPTATATAQTTTASACTVRCNKGCSFPGRCRRYVDANGNNKCDQGECL